MTHLQGSRPRAAQLLCCWSVCSVEPLPSPLTSSAQQGLLGWDMEAGPISGKVGGNREQPSSEFLGVSPSPVPPLSSRGSPGAQAASVPASQVRGLGKLSHTPGPHLCTSWGTFPPPRQSQQPSPHFRFSKHLGTLLGCLCNFPFLG